ncbi:hypothetical protein YTPLAS18_07550 [Nitrospira sp.]|nr:hypothetical protein YTPLAS18_07550 [Nitrospira sp.]
MTAVQLNRPLYVRTGSDEPVLLPRGSYAVMFHDDRHLRVVTQGAESVIVDAVVARHDQDLEHPFALAMEDPQTHDLTHILLLLPDGRALEATGSATGAFPREIPVHIFAALAKQWAAGSPVKEGLRVETKTIRAGQDYDVVVLPSGICAVLCERDDRCRAFSWRPRVTKPTTGACHLLETVPPKQSDECCVSGMKVRH